VSQDTTPGRRETTTAGFSFLALLVLHLFYVFRWTFDSDEWQHLHVAWSWTQGLLQYRDVFDNHTPLFHMATAPVVALFGETPDIIFLMRLAMTPLFLVTLGASACMAWSLFGRRAALWTPVILSAVPVFFFRSIEYRTDALWMTLWVVAVAVLLAGQAGWTRCFIVGILLGLAVCTSLKTVLLLFALGLAALLTPVIARSKRPMAVLVSNAWLLAPMFAGAVLPIAALVLYFAHRDALGALVDGAVRHNVLPGLGNWQTPWRRALFVPEMGLMALAAGWMARRQPDQARAQRAAFLALTAGAFLAALQTLWPLFTTYDLLVFYPLAVPAVIGAMLPATASAPAHAWRFPALAAALIGLVLIGYPPWSVDISGERAFLADVLRLTDPHDRVLDQKGDAIFRPRPSPYVLERITRARLALGLLPEHFQEDMIATGTCVAAWRIGRFPDRTLSFLQDNFLLVGHVRVAGRILRPEVSDGDPSGTFEIAIPATYAIVSDGGAVDGTLDDQPYTAPRRLGAGRHTFKVSFRGSRLAVIWAQAAERGFSPFESAGGAVP
jgi:hypothetical protein